MDGSTTFQSSQNIHVRCPDCFKLYAVNANDIVESRPQFQCVDCTAQFWIPYPEALETAAGMIGFPVETNIESRREKTLKKPALSQSVQAKPFSCPKCGSGYNGGQTECEKCGVLFEKFISNKNNPSARSDFSASRELKALWDAVILEYENEERHQAFMRFGFSDNNIDYVSRKYADVLDSNASDEMALKAQKEIRALSVARLEAAKTKPFHGWQDWSIPRLRFSPVLYVVAGVLIAAGLVIPGLRNLIGFGCSILFMTIMFKFYFQAAKKT